MHRLKNICKSDLLRNIRLWLAILVLIIFILKISIIPYPWPEASPSECINLLPEGGKCGFIFDEAHYIPAVRKMLRGEAANNEHPPLSKFLIMLGILVFGDNPYGWRTFITLSGAVSIYLLGLIAHEFTKSNKLSFISALFFAFDLHSFNLSSMAMLDAPALMFALLGALFFIRKRWIASGVALGLAMLSKTSAPFVLIALLTYDLLEKAHEESDLRSCLKKWMPVLEKVGFVAAAVMLIGLAVYDYNYGAYATPFEHLDYMLDYHSSLTFSEEDLVYMPLTWTNPLYQFPRIPYFVISVEVDGEKYHPVAYYGMQTPLWWMTWLVVAFALYSSYLRLKEGGFPRLELFILCWFSFNYLVYFPFAHLLHRWVYPFYFYMTVPVIALGLPKILEGDRISEAVLYALLIAQVAWFFLYFPVKPQWFIDFLLLVHAPV